MVWCCRCGVSHFTYPHYPSMLLCAQPPSLGDMSRGWRWTVFLVGLVESMLWSGTIYGWASLVHVLKVQGVYYHLCSKDPFEYSDVGSTQDAHNTTAPTPLYNNKVRSSSIHSSTSCFLQPVYIKTVIIKYISELHAMSS